MTSRYLHPSYAGRVTEWQPSATPDPPQDAVRPGIDVRALSVAARSCCCLARPAVLVMMPPSADRPHATDLLMCMHHYRTAQQQLAAAGALVADASGQVIRGQR
jgi:hypothetical protein